MSIMIGATRWVAPTMAERPHVLLHYSVLVVLDGGARSGTCGS